MQAETLKKIDLPDGIDDVLRSPARDALETNVLPGYLQKRRWFGSKGQTLDSVEFLYGAVIGAGADKVLLTEVAARVDGQIEDYTLPLGICPENADNKLAQDLALSASETGLLTDGFALDSLTRHVISGMRNETVIHFQGQRLEFRKTSVLDTIDVAPDVGIQRLSAEQSNSSLIVGRQIVLKIVRKVLAGSHPETEMTGTLTDRGFGNIAQLLGEVIRIDKSGVPHTIMLAQSFVANDGDAWQWSLDYLKEYLASGAAQQEIAQSAVAGYLPLAHVIGRRLAEMHVTLSQDTDDVAFRPEAAVEAEVAIWADGVVEQVELAVRAVQRVAAWPNEAVQQLANQFLDCSDDLCRAAQRLAASIAGHAIQMRVHGDFHLGQILVTPGDVTLIDFEGEPAKAMEQRRAKSSPLRDVAGLLRSFDYAASSALLGSVADDDLDRAARQRELMERFRSSASQAFLQAYRAVLETSPRPWVDKAHYEILLDLFLLEKSAYEIRYEAANRPSWIGIPLAGIGRVAQHILTQKEVHV